MYKATTLCLLESEADLAWIAAYIKEHGQAENILVAAYSFFGRKAASTAAFPISFFDEEAWKLDQFELSAQARRTALSWAEDVERAAPGGSFSFKGYPLALMHQFNVTQSLGYLLPSHELIGRIFDQVQPDKVLMRKRPNPFAGRNAIFSAVGPDGGFELECAGVLCRERGIPLLVHDAGTFEPMEEDAPPAQDTASPEDLHWLHQLGKTEFNKSWEYTQPPGYAAPPFGTNSTPQQVLFIVYGDYYLDEVLPSVDVLLDRGWGVIVVIIGGDVPAHTLKGYTNKGVRFYRKESFRLPGESEILNRLKGLYRTLARQAMSGQGVAKHFSHKGESYYLGVGKHIGEKEINNFPHTILELLRTEILLQLFTPCAVFTHFSVGCYNGWGSFDCLPARKLGIPTITSDHGMNGELAGAHNLSTAEYHATYCEQHRSAIIRCNNFPETNIRAIGHPRLEGLTPNADKRAEKIRLGLDPNKPVVVFCSVAEMPHHAVMRHSLNANITAVIRLKQALGDIQLIYRAHHGHDYQVLKRHFAELGIPNLSFEVVLEPPHPYLVDMLGGVDVLISQSSTALAEATVRGVPAICYCTRGYVDPLDLGHKSIGVAFQDDVLESLVGKILADPPPPHEAARARQEYMDRCLCGNDGLSGQRLAEFIEDAVRSGSVPGFDQWIECLHHNAFKHQALAVNWTEFALAQQEHEDASEAHAVALARKTAQHNAEHGERS